LSLTAPAAQNQKADRTNAERNCI